LLDRTYLVRYGVMAHVGRFSGSLGDGTPFQRGQFVVIETERGVEVGEVLTMVGTYDAATQHRVTEQDAAAGGDGFHDLPENARPVVLRLATDDEIARTRPQVQAQSRHFQLCQGVLTQFHWDWELIDVEPLLDDHTLVLHYLGPPELDAAELRAWFRTAHDLDVHFEPAGGDSSGQTTRPAADLASGHGCGASGCGHGGCGSGADAGNRSVQPEAGSPTRACGTSTHSGCSSCGIMRTLAERYERKG